MSTLKPGQIHRIYVCRCMKCLHQVELVCTNLSMATADLAQNHKWQPTTGYTGWVCDKCIAKRIINFANTLPRETPTAL